MTRHHDEMLDLCAGYALGNLSDVDRRRLDEHLASGCAECELALRDFSEGTLLLAESSPAAQPNPSVKGRILDAVAREAASDAPRRRSAGEGTARSTPLPWMGWALAAAFAAIAFFQFRTVEDLKGQLAGVESAQTDLATRLDDERQWTASMASPAAKVAFLTPTPDAREDWAGWGLYDPASKRAIIVLENLELTPDHDFELWAIGSDGPRSLGVVEIDAGGRALVRLPRVEDAPDLSAFAVSYEAKGGSPNPRQPAGPVVMVGNLDI
jgi:anti-sigma-K factor RskA